MVLQQRTKRTVGITTVAALSATILAGMGTRTLADDIQKGGKNGNTLIGKVTISAAPLPVAIRMITQQTGIDIVFINRGQQFNTVDLNVTNKPIREVLRSIALSAGAAFWEENGVYYIGGKEDAPKLTPVVETPEVREPSAQRHVRYEKIKLMYSSPRTIMRQIGAGQQDDFGDIYDQMNNQFYRSMLKSAFPTGSSLPSFSNQGQPNILNSAPQQAAPAAPTTNIQPSKNADQGAHRDNGFEFGRGQFGGGFGGGQGGGGFGGGQGGGGFGGGQGGGGFGGGQGGGGFGGGQGQGGGAAGGFLQNIGIQAQDILAFDADGSLIVQTDNEDALRQLKELIRLLDVKPRQIMVRAEFVTVLQNDISSFGIDWSMQKGNLVTGVQTGYQTSNTTFIQYSTGNLRTQMSWILTTGRGKLVAAPMATTLNNVMATFVNQQQIPVFTSQSTVTANGTVVLSSTPTTFQAATILFVLPRINADDTITLLGTVSVADLGTPVTGPNGESVPTVITQTAPVTRIIRNGDTMVVGGLTSKNTQVSSNRAPLLGDMPIIGTLFRSRNTTVRDSDLLVFITAAIIPDRSTTSTLTGPGGAPLTPAGGSALAPGGSAP